MSTLEILFYLIVGGCILFVLIGMIDYLRFVARDKYYKLNNKLKVETLFGAYTEKEKFLLKFYKVLGGVR